MDVTAGGPAIGADSGQSHYVTAPDGLRLHVREYGSRLFDALPAVCLPGLSRTQADFLELANALAADGRTPRRVLAVDYRGRGRSDYDANHQNYSLAVELGDLDAVLTALAVGPSIFIGTSRGGLLTMLAAAALPGPHRRRHPQRYRSGPRAQGADADQRLSRPHAAAAQLR